LLNSVRELNGVEAVSDRELRNNSATPFFGYRASETDPQVMSNRGGTDLLFRKDGINFFIENKLVRYGKNEECNIKNSFVQAIEYLNLYRVDAAIVFIFDAGRAKDREWDNSAEHKLIECLIVNYPICVVRIREKCPTKVYY
jgi:hypothetical protein